MSISQNFPEEGPTLNLNFAGSRTLDPRITFTRTSTATYMDDSGLIKVAPADAPRFDHRYVNGEIESLGLLVEEQRENLFPTSEVFVSGWSGGGTTNTDTILNPYGELGTVYYITTSERTRIFNADTYSTLALSFFSKKRFGGLERDYADIQIYQVAVGDGFLATYQFNFDGNNPDGTYVKDIKTEQYPNGWYRFSCRLVARADYNGGIFSTSTRIDIEGTLSDNYIWGIQVEPASFSTSYIPTSGSTATRNADNASMTDENFSDWFNTDEGTLHMRISSTQGPQSGYPRLLMLTPAGQNSQNNSLQFIHSNNSVGLGFAIWENGTIRRSYNKNVTGPEDKENIVFAYKSDGDTSAYVDGNSLTNTISNAYAQPVFGRMGIGAYPGGQGTTPRTTIESLVYYPTRLTNDQLQTLTR